MRTITIFFISISFRNFGIETDLIPMDYFLGLMGITLCILQDLKDLFST